jgi:hypothetical protein
MWLRQWGTARFSLPWRSEILRPSWLGVRKPPLGPGAGTNNSPDRPSNECARDTSCYNARGSPSLIRKGKIRKCNEGGDSVNRIKALAIGVTSSSNQQ